MVLPDPAGSRIPRVSRLPVKTQLQSLPVGKKNEPSDPAIKERRPRPSLSDRTIEILGLVAASPLPRRDPGPSPARKAADPPLRPTAGNRVPLKKIAKDPPNHNVARRSDKTARPSRSVPKSSATLRETIAKAKAAHQSVGPAQTIAAEGNGMPKLCAQIASAQTSGRLNIAARGLTTLPEEIRHMFDLEKIAGGSWAECVDLVRLNAADNQLDVLGDEFFPSSNEEEECVFETLEVMLLHGNSLSSLPEGLAMLPKLTVLDLARNRLGNECLDVIAELEALRELNLAENLICGKLTISSWKAMEVETLDLSNNQILDLDHAPSMLRRLKLSKNRFDAIPSRTQKLERLQHFDVSHNQIRGSVDLDFQSPILHIDLSKNQIDSIKDDFLELPVLQTLSLHENRLTSIPDLSRCSCLTTLEASGNSLSQFPPALTSIRTLRNVNVSKNEIRDIPYEIGLMENLTSLNLANNPLRERRFIRLETETLKQEFLLRLEPESTESLPPSPQQTSQGKRAEAVKLGPDGEIDLSSREFSEDDLPDAVKSVVLRDNRLVTIPIFLAKYGDCLVNLDLSHNKLSDSMALALPRLRNLNLCANSILTLDPIFSQFEAPQLRELDVSRNRLIVLPPVRIQFPQLTTLRAADNKVTMLEVQSVAGLTEVDVSGNEIAALDARLGLLQYAGLRTLLVGANTFRVPRREIVEKGTEAILTWLRGRLDSS